MDSRSCFKCGQPGHIARNCRQKGPPSTASASFPPSAKEDLKIYAPYIDTHCHVDYILQKTRQQSFLDFQARTPFPANYGGCISIFCDPAALSPSLSTWQDQLAIDNVWGAFGIHPHNAKYYDDKVEQKIIECLRHPKAVAWGECGLDFHYNHSPPDVQINAFIMQAVRAVELGKPLVVHSRNAEHETKRILKEYVPEAHPVHVHCFNDSADYAATLLREFSRLYIGITGAITFPDCRRLREVVADVVPLDRLLLETDAPYLTPKTGLHKHTSVNHPGTIPAIAQAISEAKQAPLAQVFEQIRENTTRCYGI